MQIIVLGMHRSGTSAVARLLNMMGAYFAPERMELPATVANPKGYWERRDVVNLHEEIFDELDMAWDQISQFENTSLTETLQQKYASRIQEIILGLDAYRPWMLKDPRLCLLLPLWRPYLEFPVCVHVYRDPIQIAQSLQQRDGATIQFGMALWEKYTLHAFSNTANIPTILVRYEDVMCDPINTIHNLYTKLSELDVQGLRLPADKEILNFIEPSLFHAKGDAALQAKYINGQQKSLVEQITTAEVIQEEDWPILSLGAQESLYLHDQHIHLITENKQLNAKLTQQESLYTQLNSQYQTALQQVADLTSAQDQLQQLQQELNERATSAELHDVQQQLNQRDEQIHNLRADNYKLTQDISELWRWLVTLQRDIQAIFDSMTWKAGNVVTRIVLTLAFRKPTLTAEDHIATVNQEIAHMRGQQVPQSQVKSTQQSNKNRQTLSDSVQFTEAAQNPHDYATWIKNYDTLYYTARQHIKTHIESWTNPPLISIIMPTYNTPEKFLRAALDSVKQQLYPYWELCIADDASSQPHVSRILQQYANQDERIKLCLRDNNGHISAASNSALALATGELVGFLDHDDVLTEHALFWVVYDFMQFPAAQLWYSDEDKINEYGERSNPYFKSDWNYDLLLSHNLVTHFAVYKADLLKQLGGLREGYEGAQDYDLVLRVIEKINPAQIRHIPRILYHWRTSSGSTASNPDEKPYALVAAQKAIQEHLDRRGIDAKVVDSPDIAGVNRVRYALPARLPLVTLIIPTYNGLSVLRQCIDSILSKTSYANYNIIVVNNNSDDPETLTYFDQLEQHDNITILDYPHPFNYAAINNAAVTQATGELIGLLNNDLEVINGEWLSEMVSHALRPDIGAVGARLWYPNDTLQHGGVVVGIGGVAGHAHKGFPRGHVGYMGRAALLQNFSAVTGACMVMRKENFNLVGGLNAEHLTVALNDVDLCLKMNKHNLRILWTPYAELYHHESATRGYEDTPEKAARYAKECEYLRKHWSEFFAADPAYSLNLTLDTQDFAFAWPPRVPDIMNLPTPE